MKALMLIVLVSLTIYVVDSQAQTQTQSQTYSEFLLKQLLDGVYTELEGMEYDLSDSENDVREVYIVPGTEPMILDSEDDN